MLYYMNAQNRNKHPYMMHRDTIKVCLSIYLIELIIHCYRISQLFFLASFFSCICDILFAPHRTLNTYKAFNEIVCNELYGYSLCENTHINEEKRIQQQQQNVQRLLECVYKQVVSQLINIPTKNPSSYNVTIIYSQSVMPIFFVCFLLLFHGLYKNIPSSK